MFCLSVGVPLMLMTFFFCFHFYVLLVLLTNPGFHKAEAIA